MTVDFTVDQVHTLARGQIKRVFGPPGTGKTTRLSAMLAQFVAERGPDSVVVVSFTHTAARAIAAAAKETGLPETSINTLHSLAYRACRTGGHFDVALDPKILADWNTTHPQWWITPDARKGNVALVKEAGDGDALGDALMAAYDVLRASLTPQQVWPAEVRRFAREWEAWKEEAKAIDFGDMIELALTRALEGERAPSNPQVIVVDEAQDNTPLETALILAWGAHTDLVVLALDDDQAINAWRGGSPEPILALATNDQVMVEDEFLPQSYRIPSAVQNVALQWIEQVFLRQPKEYRPREEGGRIYPVSYTLADVETAAAIERDAWAGKSVMVLASCQYMLLPLLKNLRDRGVPFWNQYRPAERAWNPLATASGMAVAERLFRYLVLSESAGEHTRLWTVDDIKAWMELIEARKAGLMRGAKKRPEHFPPDADLWPHIVGLFTGGEASSDLRLAVEPSLDWLLSVALKGYSEKLHYPAAVARSFGPGALVEPDWKSPRSADVRITVGTIHSAKGGESDVVYLCPSLSPAAYAQWVLGSRARDEIYRQFYVGLTRCRETTVILGSAERQVPRDMLIPRELIQR